MAMSHTAPVAAPPSVTSRFTAINWPFVALLCLIAAIGVGVLYSVAGGSMEPWARTHAIRFAIALLAFLVAAMLDIRIWMRVAVPFYLLTLAALVAGWSSPMCRSSLRSS